MATKKYNPTIAITINTDERKAVKDKLTKLADKLGASASALALFGVEQMLKHPPKTVPAGCERKAFGAGAGTSAGFWVIPKFNKDKKFCAIEVQEVASRSEAEGKSFYRYKKGEDKERKRALRQAKTEATYLLGLAGIAGSPKAILLK